MVFRYTWPALLWSLVILVLTLIPGKALPKVDIFQVDKLAHFFVFGALMVLTSYGLKKSQATKKAMARPIRVAAIYSVSLGIIIEIVQHFVTGRNFSVVDILANSIGVALGYWAFIFFYKKVS